MVLVFLAVSVGTRAFGFAAAWTDVLPIFEDQDAGDISLGVNVDILATRDIVAGIFIKISTMTQGETTNWSEIIYMYVFTLCFWKCSE